MGKIRIIYKILPSNVEEKTLEKILSRINDLSKTFGFTLHDNRIEPIAFGLNVLKILITVDEKEGVLDKIETKFKEIPEISSVNVIGMTRG